MAKKVFIGVGHGGTDAGAVANGIKEKDANLDIAMACGETLERHGVTVKLSREKDESENLSARINECNAFNPDVACDIHNNAGGGDGAEVFHAKNDKSDDALAKNILDEITKIGQNSRGLKTRQLNDGRDYYGFIRQVACPSVLVECAFLDNATDVKIIDTLAERKAMGVAIAKGILKTLGIAYKEPTFTKPTTVAKKYKKGDAVKLAKAPLYISSSSKKSVSKKTGTYYIYDGIKTNGRYRITNKVKNCGKKPTALYVTGWVKL